MKTMNTHKIILSTLFSLSLWFVASAASAATLSVSPASASYQVGNTFTISVMLDTGGAPIDGVDVHYLHFNPSVLQVVDANASSAGVQITPGTLMSATLTNTVNNAAGTVDFSQIVTAGQHYQGSGTLFTITFSVVGSGSSPLTFDATLGKTTDSNVASVGTDILSSASSGQVTVAGSTSGSTSGSTGGSSGSSASGGSSGGGTASGGSTSSGGSATGKPGTSIIFSRLLLLGSTGSDVVALQNYLGVIGSGYFGPLTQAAVEKFQLQYGITTAGSAGYGNVGPLTRAKLNALIGGTGSSAGSSSTPTTGGQFTVLLTLGTKSNDVTRLQQYLAKDPSIYPEGLVSGYYGALTQAAVGRFQVKYGITTAGSAGYGNVGPLTRAKLNALMSQ